MKNFSAKKISVCIFVILVLIMQIFSPVNAYYTHFQTADDYESRNHLPTDAVSLHFYGGITGNDTYIQNYPSSVYTTKMMQQSWTTDNVGDYVEGRYDSQTHYDIVQKRADGSALSFGHNYHVTPTTDWNNFLKSQCVRAIQAGATYLTIEEPYIFGEAGYDDAFKAEWLAYYGSAWVDPQSSQQAYFKFGKLRDYLLQRTINDVFGYIKSQYPSVKFHIAVHPQSNMFNFKGSFLTSSGYANSNIDGISGQVWSNTICNQMLYEGSYQTLPFENGYFDYSYFAGLGKAYPTKEVEVIHDPKGDGWQSNTWEYTKDIYAKQIVTSCMFSNIYRYNTNIWPTRNYGTFELEAPEYYKTIMSNIESTLWNMHYYTGAITTGNKPVRVGMLISDTSAWQSGGPGNTSDYNSIYSLVVPLLHRGLLVDSVPLESITTSANILNGYDIIFLSNDIMKPQNDTYNTKLRDWINSGGIVVYFGGNPQYENISDQWWKVAGYASQQDHLMSLLGCGLTGRNTSVTAASLSPEAGSTLAQGIGTLPSTTGINMIGYSGGTGITPMYKSGTNIVSFQKNYGSGKFVYFGLNPYYFGNSTTGSSKMFNIIQNISSLFKSITVNPFNSIDYTRGLYRGIHSISGTQTVTGKYVDLFDPSVPIITSKTVAQGSTSFLYDISNITITTTPRVVFAQGCNPTITETSTQTTVVNNGAPPNTRGVVRILSKPGLIPTLATAVNGNGKSTLCTQEWDAVTSSLLVTYWNSTSGTTINVSWSTSGTPAVLYTKRIDDRNASITYSGQWNKWDTQYGNYQMTEEFSSTLNNYAEYEFTGKSIKLIAPKDVNLGRADVYIDGVLDTSNVDFYSPKLRVREVVYSKTGLSEGSHKIKVVVNRTKNTGATDYNVVIDMFEVGTSVLDNFDDRSEHISYSGYWGNWDTDPGDYNSTEKFSNSAGSYAQFTFTGDTIKFIAPTGPNYGKANIYIDGVLVRSQVDMYTSTKQYQKIIFCDTSLEYGRHNIKVEVSGAKNASSSDYNVVIDKFECGTDYNFIDDRNSTVVYNGTWGQADNPGYYNSTETYGASGDTQLTFVGSSVRWIGTTGSNCGIANVYIDGNLVKSVDTYSATTQYQQLLYSNPSLAYGLHTIKVEVSGTKNASSSGYAIVLDKFEYQSIYNNANDRDAAVTYSGSWTQQGWTGTYLWDETYSSSSGSYAQCTFTGASVRWYTSRTNNCGIANVYIDSVLYATIDLYTNWLGRSTQEMLFTTEGLSAGSHTIKIVVSGTKNASSTGYKLYIDRFEYR